jgi:hypothetical protein
MFCINRWIVYNTSRLGIALILKYGCYYSWEIDMEDIILKYESSNYDKSKYKTYGGKSYPKDESGERWIVEIYDVYEDGTWILTRAAECDADRVSRVEYLLSR